MDLKPSKENGVSQPEYTVELSDDWLTCVLSDSVSILAISGFNLSCSHLLRKHFFVATLSPKQSLPPALGAGSVQFLDLLTSPAPQVVVQEDHLLQRLHPPSCGGQSLILHSLIS